MRMQVTLSLALRYLQRIKGGNVWEPQLVKWMSIVKRVSPLKPGCPHDVLRQTVNVRDIYETHCSTHLHMQLHAQIGSNGVGKEKTGGLLGIFICLCIYIYIHLYIQAATDLTAPHCLDEHFYRHENISELQDGGFMSIKDASWHKKGFTQKRSTIQFSPCFKRTYTYTCLHMFSRTPFVLGKTWKDGLTCQHFPPASGSTVGLDGLIAITISNFFCSRTTLLAGHGVLPLPAVLGQLKTWFCTNNRA